MKILFNTFYWFLIAGIAGVGLMLVASLVPVSGIKVKVVKSGSMEPAIHTGGIVVIQKAQTYRVGDVVTFGADTKTQIPTTHRIIAIDKGPNPIYTTKGDANDTADNANIHLSDIQGKVLFTIPYVGYVLDFAKKPIGFFLLIGVPALVIIFDELLKIYREVRVLRRRKKGGSDQDPGSGSAPVTSVPLNVSSPKSIDGIRMRAYQPSFSQVVVPARRAPFTASVATLLLAFAITTYLIPVGRTVSYFVDQELSLANMFKASSVDLQFGRSESLDGDTTYPLDTESASGYVDSLTGEELPFSFATYGSETSAPFVYTGEGKFNEGEPAACSELQLHAEFGAYSYDGPFNAFVSPVISTPGTWQFAVSLPPGGSALEKEQECEGALVFKAQPLGENGELTGVFLDTETFPVEIYNRGTEPVQKKGSVESAAISTVDEPPPADEPVADNPQPETPPAETPPVEDTPAVVEPPPAEPASVPPPAENSAPAESVSSAGE